MISLKSGFYIHIPYCHSRCSYCDFLSDDKFDSGDLEKYRARILNDMNEIFSILPGHEIDTLFIGGGTPSVYSPEKLSEFVKKLTSLSGSNLSETTVEINPNVVDIAYMNKLHETGVFNRISFGLQSPFSKDNEYLGRKHLPESLDIISFAASLFDNVSIDLICGFPGFVPYKVISELERHGILQNIEHVSVYMLKYPQRLLDLHNLTEEDDDLQSSQYIEISEILEKKDSKNMRSRIFQRKVLNVDIIFITGIMMIISEQEQEHA